MAAPADWKQTVVNIPGTAFPRGQQTYLIVFQSVKDSTRKVGSRASIVFEREMYGLAFAIAFFFGSITLGFFESVLDVGVRPQTLREFPFFHRVI